VPPSRTALLRVESRLLSAVCQLLRREVANLDGPRHPLSRGMAPPVQTALADPQNPCFVASRLGGGFGFFLRAVCDGRTICLPLGARRVNPTYCTTLQRRSRSKPVPSHAAHRLPVTGTVTFLFTDIEGSTRPLQELGDDYAEVLVEHRRLLREAFDRHGGVEVDTQGDAFFVAFSRAGDALAAVGDGQAALQAGPVRVRMGIHTGEPLVIDVRLNAARPSTPRGFERPGRQPGRSKAGSAVASQHAHRHAAGSTPRGLFRYRGVAWTEPDSSRVDRADDQRAPESPSGSGELAAGDPGLDGFRMMD
jgi:hypothetical protein